MLIWSIFSGHGRFVEVFIFSLAVLFVFQGLVYSMVVRRLILFDDGGANGDRAVRERQNECNRPVRSLLTKYTCT